MFYLALGESRVMPESSVWGWDSNNVVWVSDDVSNAELLDVIRELANREGVPSRERIYGTEYHPAVFVRRFGSYTAALERAGVLDGPVDGVLDEEIMDELYELASTFRRSPVPRDVEGGALSVSKVEVYLRFGFWNNALREAYVDVVSNAAWR
jgi:hypothetical protein